MICSELKTPGVKCDYCADPATLYVVDGKFRLCREQALMGSFVCAAHKNGPRADQSRPSVMGGHGAKPRVYPGMVKS